MMPSVLCQNKIIYLIFINRFALCFLMQDQSVNFKKAKKVSKGEICSFKIACVDIFQVLNKTYFCYFTFAQSI